MEDRWLKIFNYFKSSIIFGILGILLGGFIGIIQGHSVSGFLVGLTTCISLAMIESGMSLDNSVVASGLLEDMNPTWQKRYKTWGMLIAVGGMRFAFPVIVVSVALGITPWAAVMLAINHPSEYSTAIGSHKNEIMAFGGSFLCLIVFNYFFDEEKDNHWLEKIEVPLSSLGAYSYLPLILTSSITLLTSLMVPESEFANYIICGFSGILGYYFVNKVIPKLTETESGQKSEFGKFLHLEMIDASFSFDGVIGAFAITTNIFYIMIGLGAGALIVRCLTLMLVDMKSGEVEYPIMKYLENGAFVTIALLIAAMYLGIVFEIPDVIIGCIGFVIIGLSGWSGIREDRKRILVPNIEIKDEMKKAE